MAIVINGSGTVTGLAVGGLPDGTVDAGTVAADVATQAEIDAKLNLAGGTMTGNIVMGDDTSIGISDSAERIEFDGAGDISILGAKLGVGTATPQTEMHVVTANTSLVHIGGTANANGNYQGISLGYSEAGNLNHRKVAVVSAGIQDGQARQDFHVLVDTDSNTGSVVLADSKFKIDGISGRCQAKNGLMFGTDTAAANALDDYEEGTWTPSITFSSSAPNLTMGNINAGYYTKIGDTVHFHMTLHVNAYNSGSGNLIIGGLPFAHTGTYIKRFITASLSADHLNWESDWVAVNLTNATGGTTGFTYTAQRDNAASEYIAQANYPTGNTYHFSTGHYYTDS